MLNSESEQRWIRDGFGPFRSVESFDIREAEGANFEIRNKLKNRHIPERSINRSVHGMLRVAGLSFEVRSAERAG